MNKQKLLDIFNELLNEWYSAESTVINDRGNLDDYDSLKEAKEDFKKKFVEALGDAE